MAVCLVAVESEKGSKRAFFAAQVLLGLVVACWASTAEAGLMVNSWDARASWPASAPVWTSSLPFFGADPATVTDSVGVRSNRRMTQTFDVGDKISVESIFIGYRANPDPANTLNIRLLTIPDVGAAYTTPGVVTTVAVTTPTPNTAGERYRALQLDWVDSNPLILEPQPGIAGYALELLGANTTGSPIAWIYRKTNPYAGGRAFEQSNLVTANDDFVIAITGQVIPEPAAAMLCGLALVFVSASCRTRDGRFGRQTG